MALDLGTLYVNIKANTADTQRNIDNVKTSLAGIKTETNNTTNVLNKSFDDMGAGIGKAGSAVTGLMNGVKGGISGVLGAVSSVASSIPVVGGIAAAAVGLVSSAISDQKKALEEYKGYLGTWANEVDNWATNASISGMSEEAVQFYSVMSDLTDVSWGTIQTGMRMLKNSIIGADDGSNQGAAQAFKELGVALKNPDGSSRPLDDIFNDVTKALQQIEDPMTRTAYATDLFGRSAQELNPLLDMSSDAFENLQSSYNDAYSYIDSHKLSDLQAYQDTKDLLSVYTGALEAQKAASIAPFETLKLQAEIEFTKVIADALETGVINAGAIQEAGDMNGTAMYEEDKTVHDQARVERWANRLLDYYTDKAYNEAAGADWENQGVGETIYYNAKKDIDWIANVGKGFASLFAGEAGKAFRRSYWLGEYNNAPTGEHAVTEADIAFANAFEAGEVQGPVFPGVYEVGANYTNGLVEGIEDPEAQESVTIAAENVAQTMLDATKGKLIEQSPSKAAYEIGLNWDAGLANGIIAGAKTVKAAATLAAGVAMSNSTQTINVYQNNSFAGGQNSFANQYFTSKRLSREVAQAVNG